MAKVSAKRRRVTMRDVAKLAGVSVQTVSAVINNKPGITDHTRRKVLAAITELNYRPSRVAQRLRSSTTQIIGVIVSDIGNPFFSAVVRGMEDVAYAHEYTLLLCNSDEDPEKERLYLDILEAEDVAGVLLAPAHEDSVACQSLISSGRAVVAFDRLMTKLQVDTVLTDNAAGTAEAVRHLVSLGHRRIGIVSGPTHISSGRERLEGWEKTMKECGIVPERALMTIGDFKQRGGYEQTRLLLEQPNPPTALFVANNLMTLGALAFIHERGLRIPEDIAVVGFDDMPWAACLAPPLTAVAQPTYALGRHAANRLLQRVSNPDRPVRTIRLKPQLIIRESCGFRRTD
jgi:DNA-binding LacI/PurR family transcriptional regulator